MNLFRQRTKRSTATGSSSTNRTGSGGDGGMLIPLICFRKGKLVGVVVVVVVVVVFLLLVPFLRLVRIMGNSSSSSSSSSPSSSSWPKSTGTTATHGQEEPPPNKQKELRLAGAAAVAAVPLSNVPACLQRSVLELCAAVTSSTSTISSTTTSTTTMSQQQAKHNNNNNNNNQNEHAFLSECLAHPRHFFQQRLMKAYQPSPRQVLARDTLAAHQDRVTVVAIGSMGSFFCREATGDDRTFCTNQPELDLLQWQSWMSLVTRPTPPNHNHNNNNTETTHSSTGASRRFWRLPGLFAEHVLEHFDPNQVLFIAAAAFYHLQPGGVFRVAVPDGYHPNAAYQDYIRPGTTPSGYGAHHLVAWTVDTLPGLFQRVGFTTIRLVEYHTASGEFVSSNDAYEMDAVHGKIRRSWKHDARNAPNHVPKPGDAIPKGVKVTSLWFDAIKPNDCGVVVEEDDD